MRRAWEREGWRRAELQWVQRQDARWRSKGGKGVSWRLRQRKQRRRRLATASNAMQRLPARGIGPGTGRQGPLQRGVGGAAEAEQGPADAEAESDSEGDSEHYLPGPDVRLVRNVWTRGGVDARVKAVKYMWALFCLQ